MSVTVLFVGQNSYATICVIHAEISNLQFKITGNSTFSNLSRRYSYYAYYPQVSSVCYADLLTERDLRLIPTQGYWKWFFEKWPEATATATAYSTVNSETANDYDATATRKPGKQRTYRKTSSLSCGTPKGGGAVYFGKWTLSVT